MTEATEFPAAVDTFLDGFTDRDWQTRDPESVSDPVNMAVIGTGWFTREWALPGIQRSSFTEPTVGVDVDPDALDRTCREFDLETLTPEEFRNGVAADEYDAVYVATPNSTHLDYVEAAASLGFPVLCEKPMEATVERAERLVRTCEAADVPLMVGYRMQTEPAVRRMKALVSAGFIGDPVAIHANMSQTMLDEVAGDPDTWRLDPEMAGGGALMDLGIYPLNTARFILERDPLRVSGRTWSNQDAFGEVDEHASARLEFPDDLQAHVTASQNAQHASRMEITGTRGQLVLDPAFYEREPRKMTIVRDGMEVELDVPPVHQLEEEFAYFGHQLLEESQMYPNGDHALIDMRVLSAVYDSAANEEPVTL
ncbi:MAG: D-xylose 1-dehydrogenase Gfo6 [Halodesulfurarchaeum sp.]